MESLAIAFILLALAITLLAIDVFVPSGGVILILTAVTSIGSVLFAFRHSMNAGIWFSIGILGSIPVFVWLFIRVWPQTPVGKLLLLSKPEAEKYRWSTASKVPDINCLVGMRGRAATDLLPAGTVEIEGIRFESLSDGQVIEHGHSVRVVRIDMGRLVVVPEASSQEIPQVPHDLNSGLLNQEIGDLGLESIKE